MSSYPLSYASPAAPLFDTGYIHVRDCSVNTSKYYPALAQNDCVFLEGKDIAEIAGYTLGRITYINEGANTEVVKPNFFRGSTQMVYDFSAQCFNISAVNLPGANREVKVESILSGDAIFYRLDKMLYLMHAQWFIEDEALNVHPVGGTLIDFIDQKVDYIIESSVKHESLLMNGEGKWAHSFNIVMSKLLNDCDLRIILPFGSELIMDETYKDALLQLVVADDRFLDAQGQAAVSELISASTFNQVKTFWNTITDIQGLPLNIESVVSFFSDTYATNFSIWNDPSIIDTSRMSATHSELETIGDVLTLISIVVNFNETLKRSESWGDEFLDSLDILNLDPYTRDIVGDAGRRIKNAAIALRNENQNSLEAAVERAAFQITGMLIEKAADLILPIGKFKAIVSASIAMLKTDPAFALHIDDADLMNTVHALINVESVSVYQLADAYLKYGNVIQLTPYDGRHEARSHPWFGSHGNTAERQQANAIQYLRDCTKLLLNVTLRNKCFLYRFNMDLNRNPLWAGSVEAETLRQDIYGIYAMIIELDNTMDYDKTLIINPDFTNLVSSEYGAMRSAMTADALFQRGEMPEPEDSVDSIYEDFIRNGGYVPDVRNGEFPWEYPVDAYAILDIDDDGVPELIIGGTQDDGEFSMFWIYTYDLVQNRVVYVYSIYCIWGLSYSPKYKALAYTYPRPNIYYAETFFNDAQGRELFTITRAYNDFESYTMGVNTGEAYLNYVSISEEEYYDYINEPEGFLSTEISSLMG